ncbi:MAG: ABC transporter ATP-binding protein/permease [Lachnospiraceae bacterium]|nr:ABC transporter ATP-binding protein/permease [Lachnospiraceae bacterium]
MKTEKTLYQQLRGEFFQHNKLLFGLAAFSAFFSGFGGLIISWLLKALIDTAADEPGSMSFGMDMILVGGFLVLMIMAFMLDYTTRPAFIRKAMTQYKNMAFEKLMGKGISTFRDESTATYLSSLTNDATSIETNYLAQLLSLFTMSVMFFGSIALMIWYSPLFTAVAVGVTILPLFASLLTGKKMVVAEKKVSEQNKNFTAVLTDCLGGFSVIKSFKAEKEIFKMFSAQNKELEGSKFTKERIKTIVGLIGSMAGMLAQTGVFVVGTYLIISGYDLTTGTVMMFVNLMNFMIQPIAALPGLLAGRKASLGLVKKLADALEQNNENSGTEYLNSLKNEISLKDVSFGYDNEKEILHNISAEFKAAGAYAIVGASGSGKSTLLNLIMASSSDYKGSILMDGKEIRDIKAESLYDAVSVIQQNVFVFNASIRDNVTMFREFPEEELDSAIKHAHLDELIAKRGEDTLCGENGSGLSGGEKQRISIARSLLKKSSILLADEATAALDAQTAWQVSNDILDLEGITRIVVTHSLEENLLKRYDSILVLKDGKVEEFGSFDELMEKQGYFHALYTVSQ